MKIALPRRGLSGAEKNVDTIASTISIPESNGVAIVNTQVKDKNHSQANVNAAF